MRRSTITIVILTIWSAAGMCADHPPGLARLPEVAPSRADNPSTPAKVALGKQLFFDVRLSGNNTQSCATCHIPDKAFADGERFSRGAAGRLLKRNTQGLLNAGWFDSYFWDGRSSTLEDQAMGPIANPDEMDQDLDELVRELKAIPDYAAQFQNVFASPVTRDGISKALACYQRTLISGPSRVDQYLAGDKSALTANEVRGMELFVGDAGCIRCHHGPLLTDGKFYRLGVSFKDEGRSAATGKADDRYKFRTPGLRDISRTGPYMHDGSLRTLQEVVFFYLRSAPLSGPDSLPVDIKAIPDVSLNDVDLIVDFLKALDSIGERI